MGGLFFGDKYYFELGIRCSLTLQKHYYLILTHHQHIDTHTHTHTHRGDHSHPPSQDITLTVVSLLYELTDADALPECDEPEAFVDALVL